MSKNYWLFGLKETESISFILSVSYMLKIKLTLEQIYDQLVCLMRLCEIKKILSMLNIV
jgi:hypothetical protein